MNTPAPRSRALSRGLFLLLFAFTLAMSTGCPVKSKTKMESGWIPNIDGSPIWTEYEVRPLSGLVIYQDDMTFGLQKLRAFQQAVEAGDFGTPDPNAETPYASFDSFTSWPDAEVVYDAKSIDRFDGICAGGATSCMLDQADQIRAAIAVWNTETDFTVRAKSSSDDYWVEFVRGNNANDCRSDVGYKDGWAPNNLPFVDDPQRIWLGANCMQGAVIHEIGHTIGFRHEQTRRDRNSYVTVIEDNIRDGKEHNFERNGKPWGEYDYRSIMHYGDRFFGTIHPSGIARRTLISLIPLPNGIMGQSSVLSKMDIRAANYLADRARGGFKQAGDRAHFDGVVGNFPDRGELADRSLVANVDNDNRPDLVGFRDGEVLVARGAGNGTFGATESWHPNLCRWGKSCALGDVTGDGLDDLVSFDRGNGDVIVAPSDGSRFVGSSLWQVSREARGSEIHVADVNGDCFEDVVFAQVVPSSIARDTVIVHVGLSGGNGLAPVQYWDEVPGAEVVAVSRINSDSLADLLTVDAHGTAWGYYSTGASLLPGVNLADRFCRGGRCQLADINGDGRDDLVHERPDQHHFLLRLEVAIHNGSAFRTEAVSYHEIDCMSPTGCLYANLDSDLDDDVLEPLAHADRPGDPGRAVFAIRNNFRAGPANQPAAFGPATCTPAPPPPAGDPWIQATDFPVDDVVSVGGQPYARAGSTISQYVDDLIWRDLGGTWIDMAATHDNLYGLNTINRIHPIGADGVVGGNIMRGYLDVIAGQHALYGVHSTNNLYEYGSFCGGNYQAGLTRLSDPGYAFVAGGNLPNGSGDVGGMPSLYRYSSGGVSRLDYYACSWEYIGASSSTEVLAGGREVYAQHSSGILRRYTGRLDYFGYPRVWETIGDAGAEHAVDPESGVLYRLSADKSQIDRYDGVPGQWTRIGGPADRIWVTQGQVWASSPGSGSVFRLSIR